MFLLFNLNMCGVPETETIDLIRCFLQKFRLMFDLLPADCAEISLCHSKVKHLPLNYTHAFFHE